MWLRLGRAMLLLDQIVGLRFSHLAPQSEVIALPGDRTSAVYGKIVTLGARRHMPEVIHFEQQSFKNCSSLVIPEIAALKAK